MSTTVAETATTAENADKTDDSMEKLQIDEEDEKNVSLEDILGGEALQMSDSEDDETSAPTTKQVSPRNSAHRLQDSDEERNEDNANEGMEKNAAPKHRKKIAIIDSESEEEQEEEAKASRSTTNPKESKHSDEEEEEDLMTKQKSKKKISAIVDSDSEEDPVAEDKDSEARASTEWEKNNDGAEDEELKSEPKPKKKISAIIDTDSEEEQQEEEERNERRKQNKKNKTTEKKRKQRLESGDELSGQSSDGNQSENETRSKLKGIVDSESESERCNNEEPMEQEDASEASASKQHKAKPMRASAKKALDGMQAIQSEQQRLHREAHISVPYHQPKPRTLKEFLSRRTINKPLAVALAGGSPMPSKEPRRSLALRMNDEELQAYAKLMEERAKEATEFFKSESEHEDDDEDGGKDVVANADADVDTIDKPDQVDNEIGDQLEEKTVEVEDHVALSEIEPVVENIAALTEAETLEDNQVVPEIVSPTKTRLVTEVVELPKLDLSNLDITPPSKPSTPRISEAIRRIKNEKSSDISPSLKGDANMVIDLETGDMFAKKPTGVDDLLQRLMKTREAKKHKTTETVNILSAAHGKLELSKVSIHLHEEEPVIKEQKPGAAYLKMQDHLKTLITNKRMEELRKKQAEEMENSIDEADEDEDMDIDEAEEYEPDAKPNKSELIINDDEEIVEADNAEDVEEGEDDDVEVDAGEAEAEADLEAESGTEAPEQEETSSSDSEPEEETQTSKRKNRIIRAFEDDNSDEDDVDLLQTPKPSNAPPATADELQLSAHKLFDTEVQRSASDEENELLGLCSGRFTQSEISSAAPTVGALISQIPITQTPASTQPEELEALCSGTFETQPAPESNKIISSDEEAKQPLETDKPRQKKLTKRRQKKKAKLGFSDDEESDDDSDNNEEEQDQEECEVEEAEEVPETFVDYDSEENEIVVEMTKKDRKLRASNFVENEAELSESEWGSADEDEKNMDCYDIELGDEDQFDREKLRNELGQIHARKMLDQDIREVRKIKDMLFEDEEGAVRQRQFRWKNADNGLGFSLDDPRNQNGDAEANEGSGDEENEHLWRKIRYEREQLLLEKGLKEATVGSGLPLSPAVTNSNTTIRKLTIITAKKTTVEAKKSSPFLISKTSQQQQQQQRAVRGSFLVRDKETLNKLAGLTKGSAGDLDGAAGTVSVKSAKAKNFVFATLTEEEHENQKRKAADLLNSSSETGINFMKKPRLEPRREKCLIDQLL
ncbi:uncharacterized protein Dmoj_GI12289 [Drosophila mojavensis]|uniref:Elongation factor 1 beta central acidic region eukaryote domain-containing protein n=1 Tax=Drosophila mojavensis TaxID=7230 RepID=B4L0K0_DROMO|nr:uncharacterized protein Dmoj_GI12289 [Drosophila mojavensis]